MGIFLWVLTVILIFVSLFLILVVLAQKSKDAGMGAALGGGAAEAAFGADTGNVLSKSTIWAAVVFFILAFALYLGRISEASGSRGDTRALPDIAAPAAPAATAPTTATPGVTVPAATTPAAPAAATTTGSTAPVETPATKKP